MKLSIITVNLNNKDGLKKTAESIITQSCNDFESIVIDGGPTDGSKELIEQFSSHMSYWVSEPDKGIYNAMNKGIKVAKGEYLQFLNSGDYLVSENTLKKVFSLGRGEDILFGNNTTPNRPSGVNKSIHTNTIYCSDLIHSSFCHQATFIKKELFDKYGYYDESMKISSDWKFFFETILIHKCSYHYIDINIVFYDPNGISSKNVETRERERRQVLEKHLPDYVIADYFQHLRTNEVMKYPLSQKIFALLYKSVRLFEKIKKYQ